MKYPFISGINANIQNPLRSSFEAHNYYMDLKASRAKTDYSTVCVFFARRPCKKCSHVSNSTFDYIDGTNPIAGKGIQLRSSTPIMTPDDIKSPKLVNVERKLNVFMLLSITDTTSPL